MENMKEEDQLLELSLATFSADSSAHHHHLLRRKRRRRDEYLNHLFNPPKSRGDGCREAKIFSLLKTREKMLKGEVLLPHNVEDHGKSHGLHSIQLLLMAVAATSKNDTISALDNLIELYKFVSLRGTSLQRVVAYFADVLAKNFSPFITNEPTKEEQFQAFTDLYRVSPFFQFAHFTANQAIIEAFEKEEDVNNQSLHVIDFDHNISYGFQWPSLIQSLSEKANNAETPLFLRITCLGRSLEELEETEQSLVSFSKGFRNLVFEFNGLLTGSKIDNMRKKTNQYETVAVNLFFHLNSLNNNSNFENMSDTMNSVRSFEPSIVILMEPEGTINNRFPRSLMGRFMEDLDYFAAMFDALDVCLHQESAERLNIEKNYLGKEIERFLKSGFSCPEYEGTGTWKERMERHKFERIKVSSKSLIQAKLLLKIRGCGGSGNSDGGRFRVFEKDSGRAISLGWQYVNLLTVSAWHCV